MLFPDPATYLVLPPPISTNALFRNVSGRGRVVTKAYRAWRKRARDLLKVQRLHRYVRPVEITLYVGEAGVGRMDADNTLKAPIDALVEAEVLPDDTRRCVRSVASVWVSNMTACIVLIEPSICPIAAREIVDRVPQSILEAAG